MASTINFLRLLADPTRLRLLLLLEQEELSVAELQQILGGGTAPDDHGMRWRTLSSPFCRRLPWPTWVPAKGPFHSCLRKTLARLLRSIIRPRWLNSGLNWQKSMNSKILNTGLAISKIRRSQTTVSILRF